MKDPFALTGAVRLQRGREVSVRRRHPWVYRGALLDAPPADPGPVRVVAASGEPLGIALSGSSGGSLALRMVAFGEERWDRAVLAGRLAAALRLRRSLALDADVFRLVHAEGDHLPGLAVDVYDRTAVIETFEKAWLPLLDDLAGWLASESGIERVLHRDGTRSEAPRPLRGSLPSGPVTVREGAYTLVVDLVGGQKTGMFIDQRENRRRFAAVSSGRKVLNLFSYSGGFAVAALASGASAVVNVDASAAALDLAAAAYRANGFDAGEEAFRRGDAFQVARDLIAAGAVFDAVIVDPPAFARRKDDVPRALAGYKDVNLQALKLLAPGGFLLSCSCSALVREEAFSVMLASAALDAGRPLTVLERRGAGPDHPVDVACPETRHLKAWLCVAA